MQRMLRDRRALAVFLGPAMLVYAFAVLIPVPWSIGYSFYRGSIIGGFKYVGLENFVLLWSDTSFWRATNFTLRYAVVATIGQVGIGLALALIYAFWVKRGSNLLRTLVFFPVVLPSVAVAQLFVKLFAIAPQYGLVNSVLELTNLESWVAPWLGEGSSAFWVLVVMDIWRAMGFYAVILFAGIIEIPSDLIESGRIDGATGWQITRWIVLPLLRPILLIALIFAATTSLKVFDSVLALTGGGPGQSTTPLTLYMYNTAFGFLDYGYASAIAVSLGLMVMIVVLILLKYSRRDVT